MCPYVCRQVLPSRTYYIFIKSFFLPAFFMLLFSASSSSPSSSSSFSDAFFLNSDIVQWEMSVTVVTSSPHSNVFVYVAQIEEFEMFGWSI